MPKMHVPTQWQIPITTTLMNTPTINELQNLRLAINHVDMALANLLAYRADLSRRAQAVKTVAGLPIVDPQREAEVKFRYDVFAPGSAEIAASILSWCRHGN
jgi:chorismate mutase